MEQEEPPALPTLALKTDPPKAQAEAGTQSGD
jgi:hypothetical protein